MVLCLFASFLLIGDDMFRVTNATCCWIGASLCRKPVERMSQADALRAIARKGRRGRAGVCFGILAVIAMAALMAAITIELVTVGLALFLIMTA